LPVSLPQELPVSHSGDIIVVGGGPGGFAAAVAAARKGADVLLVEHYGFLGGMAVSGEVNPFMPNHCDGESLDTGIFEEWVSRIDEYGGKGPGRVFDPNAAALAAEDLCLEAGVRLLFHHRAVHVETTERNILGIVLHSKSGLTAAQAKLYVDATGDGDVAALAGCDFEYGGEDTPDVQPMSLCFKLKLSREGVPEQHKNTEVLSSLVDIYDDQIQEVYQAAKASGEITCPRENVLKFRSVEKDTVHFNTTRIVKLSAIDGTQLSAAEIEGRRQVRQLLKLFQDRIPIFRNCRLYSIAPQIGVRESRRVRGRSYLVREDFLRGAKFPDGIARVTYPIDIHSTSGSGTEIVHLPEGVWYEVPYGCLLPRDMDNLLMACRAISVSHSVHSSMRVIPPVCSIGQAAGTAAAMALAADCLPFELDGKELKADLIRQGRNLV
jgi:hypothetical protein